ncbi:MAG: flagellar hook-associated protein FlgK [Rubrivivax sp.]|nr:MAG: flagellar hook-associated protein FlgK [Rubrivivax sp.]
MGSGLFALGTRAMFANTAMLETVSNNISNANTDGYSRQEVQLATEDGRFTGAGFFGRGVRISTVARTADPYLAREANQTSSVAAADQARLAKLMQLEKVFPLGQSGIGYSAGQMLNSFVDVANQPQDLSARQVVLARAEDVASKMRSAAGQLTNLQEGVASDLRNTVAQVNSLTQQVADINQKIASVKGVGHQPNDLLDQRDLLIKQLNGLIQVTTVEADDGTLGVFIGGGQRLVLNNSAEKLSISTDLFDPAKARLMLSDSGGLREVNQSLLQGGTISGLLKVQNVDIPESRNLIGQMAAALAWRVNQQQSFGIDLGTPAASGAPLFSVGGPQVMPSTRNTSSLASPPITMTVVDGRQLQASDYSLEPDIATPGQFTLTRLSDGQTTSVVDGTEVDGFRLNVTGAVPDGDRFQLRPVGRAAQEMARVLDKPTGIAAASPFTATVAPANQGTASVASLVVSATPAATMPPLNGDAISIVFTSATGDYELQAPAGTAIASGTWTPGQPISYNGFDLKLNGVPGNGDVINVAITAYPSGNNGNAQALLSLRDEDLVGRQSVAGASSPGSSITDAYSQIIGKVGVRVQGAQTTADISATLAANAEGIMQNKVGVNLDEEAARLIQYQQSYQAAAKILQIAQSVFDTLLEVAR